MQRAQITKLWIKLSASLSGKMHLKNTFWIWMSPKFKILSSQRTTQAWKIWSLQQCFKSQIIEDKSKKLRLSCFKCSLIVSSITTKMSGSLLSRNVSLATNPFLSKVAQFTSCPAFVRLKQKKPWVSFLKILLISTIAPMVVVIRMTLQRNLNRRTMYVPKMCKETRIVTCREA